MYCAVNIMNNCSLESLPLFLSFEDNKAITKAFSLKKKQKKLQCTNEDFVHKYLKNVSLGSFYTTSTMALDLECQNKPHGGQ